jgi:hypothetical protein
MSGIGDQMVKQLQMESKSRKKRLHELYNKPSHLCIPQMHVASHQCPGETDVGMVRLAYRKIRSLREAKDYENVHKRNSWKDLVGDLRHGIRVCMKAQGFVNILMESSKRKREPISLSWCANASLENQRMWMDLLSFVKKPSVKSQAGIFSKLELDPELANYKAMIMSSMPTSCAQPTCEQSDDSLPPEVSNTSSIQCRTPSSLPPPKAFPTMAELPNSSGTSEA